MDNNTFELELVPVKIGETSFELWTVKRWKEVVETGDGNGAEYISGFPLWIKIWEAAMVLCEHLGRMAMKPNATLLELGSGTGITGIMLGAMGNKVTLTDYDDNALALLKKNAAHNKLENVQVQKLDWLHPTIKETYDIIFGAEIIYKEAFIEPVFELLKKYLKSDGTVFIAHDVNRKVMVEFLNRANSAFKIQSVVKKMTSGSDETRIVIHSLNLK